jgi:hypothetical protein
MPKDRRDDFDDDDEPRPKRRAREEEEDEPRPKSRRRDDDDDAPRPKSRRRDEDDEVDDYDDAPAPKGKKGSKKGGGFAKVVPYRNGAALGAYYCGVFGLIPVLGFVLGPIAFILGIIGLMKAKKNPKAHGTGHAIAGIILGIVDVPLWIILWYTVFKDLMNPPGG